MNSLNKKLSFDPGPLEGIINSSDDAYKAVRHRYKEGADLIKITATGGVLSNAKNGQNPQMTLDEMKAIVSTAKDYGFKVAAHAHGAEGDPGLWHLPVRCGLRRRKQHGTGEARL